MQNERTAFGSKLGLILATAGSAVGLGNVWRFPYMTGQNGGGAFLLVYIGCVLLLGIPCMVSEFIIGRHGAANAARAYSKMAGGTAWKWIGFLCVFGGFCIISYYAVVSGWCAQYIFASAAGRLNGDPAFVRGYFAEFSTSRALPIVWTVVMLGITHWIIIHGVRSGIERVSKLLMPALFVLLVVLMAAACALPGAWAGVKFLFCPDFSKVGPGVFLAALGQAFYSLSIGVGCVCTYASYYSRSTDLFKSALQISAVDTLVALMAGLIIFPAAFSVGISPESGPALVFITLPNVFNQAFSSMPVVGWAVSLMFYALLTLAALTSLISMHEIGTAFLCEETRMTRRRAACWMTAAAALVGAVCSLSLGDAPALTICGTTLFDWFDFCTGQLMLPVCGLLTSLFIGWYVPKTIVRDEFSNWGTLRSRCFGAWLFAVRWVCPPAILAIILHQFNVI